MKLTLLFIFKYSNCKQYLLNVYTFICSIDVLCLRLTDSSIHEDITTLSATTG